jgi:hypothetical protein
LALNSGIGHYFKFLLRHHLVLNKIPFRSVQQNKQVIFITIGEALRIVVRALPILSFSLCCTNTTGAVIRISPEGDGQRIKKNPQKLLIGAANSWCSWPIGMVKVLRFTLKCRVQRSANNISI